MLSNLTVKSFLEKTAAGTPVPGGGSVAALGGALAAGLLEMVAGLTVGRAGFEPVELEMRALIKRAAGLRHALTDAIDRDAEAYDSVMSAYRLPKNSAAEKLRRQAAVQAALKQAARVPLEVAKDALAILGFVETAVKKGNPNAVTDGAVGALLARTAALAALYNVKTNLLLIKDRAFVEKLSSEAAQLETQVNNLERRVLKAVDL